jgi:hypothetical protein
VQLYPNNVSEELAAQALFDEIDAMMVEIEKRTPWKQTRLRDAHWRSESRGCRWTLDRNSQKLQPVERSDQLTALR